MTIDDQLLAGFLLFAMNEQNNKQHPMLKEFIQLTKTTLDPSALLAKKHRGVKKSQSI